MKLQRALFSAVILTILFTTGFQTNPVQGEEDPGKSIYLPLVGNKYDPAWVQGQPIPVQLTPTPLSLPYLIVDSSGRPHILWDTWSGNNAYIYHTYLTDQGWSTPAPIAPTLGNSKLLNHPVAGPNNEIYLVWYNALNSGGPFRIMYAAWDGSAWGPEFELLGNGPSIYINGMTRLDRQGVPNVTYLNTDGAFTSQYYYQKWNGSTFSARQMISKPDYVSTVWLDSDGGVRFYGDDYYSNTLHYSYWKDGAFLVSNQIAAGKLSYRNGFLDGKNNLHLTKLASVPVPGGNVSGIYHQCLKGDLTWGNEQVITGQDNVLNSSIAYDENLSQVIAWTHGDNQTITTVFLDGCQIGEPKEVSLPPLPDGKIWGQFARVASSSETAKTCFLSRENYSSNIYWLECLGPQ